MLPPRIELLLAGVERTRLTLTSSGLFQLDQARNWGHRSALGIHVSIEAGDGFCLVGAYDLDLRCGHQPSELGERVTEALNAIHATIAADRDDVGRIGIREDVMDDSVLLDLVSGLANAVEEHARFASHYR